MLAENYTLHLISIKFWDVKLEIELYLANDFPFDWEFLIHFKLPYLVWNLIDSDNFISILLF